MKDLYSFHSSEVDFQNYYEKVKEAYKKIFTRLGFKFKIAKASGGVFTDKFTHEFQVLSESGEDTIYWKDDGEDATNEEVLEGDKKDFQSAKSIEVGNIFPLGTWYAEKMGMSFIDVDGKRKPVWFGSYGIGPTRVMGTLVEVSHDEKGIIWNKQISPFDVHLIGLNGKGKEIYERLKEKNVEVLFDDRDLGAGEKFADCDLIGIPVRLVVSEKSGDKIEYKERSSDEVKLLDFKDVVELL